MKNGAPYFRPDSRGDKYPDIDTGKHHCLTARCRGVVNKATERSPYCYKCRWRKWKAANPLKYQFGNLRRRAKERGLKSFCDGTKRVIVSKGSICGWGQNWQHCSDVYYCGVSDSWEEYYQTVRRCYRFGQKNPVNANVVISDREGAVLSNLKRKESDAAKMSAEMVKHMAAISSREIKGVVRDLTEYKPKQKIKLPSFLTI